MVTERPVNGSISPESVLERLPDLEALGIVCISHTIELFYSTYVGTPLSSSAVNSNRPWRLIVPYRTLGHLMSLTLPSARAQRQIRNVYGVTCFSMRRSGISHM